jgi:hypothetical protein
MNRRGVAHCSVAFGFFFFFNDTVSFWQISMCLFVCFFFELEKNGGERNIKRETGNVIQTKKKQLARPHTPRRTGDSSIGGRSSKQRTGSIHCASRESCHTHCRCHGNGDDHTGRFHCRALGATHGFECLACPSRETTAVVAATFTRGHAAARIAAWCTGEGFRGTAPFATIPRVAEAVAAHRTCATPITGETGCGGVAEVVDRTAVCTPGAERTHTGVGIGRGAGATDVATERIRGSVGDGWNGDGEIAILPVQTVRAPAGFSGGEDTGEVTRAPPIRCAAICRGG